MNIPSPYKILYIFIGGCSVFIFNNHLFLSFFFLFNLTLFLLVKTEKKKSFKFLEKVKWFLLLIFLMSAFTGENDFPILQIKKFTIAVSYDGIIDGIFKAGKVATMLIITQIVRLTTKDSEFTHGLKSFGLGNSTSESINEIIEIVLGEKNNKKKGQGKNQKEKENNKSTSAFDALKGKVGNLPDKIRAKNESARAKLKSSNNSIAESALTITLIRMVKIAPGLPLAPGHKNILIFPVFIYGIKKSTQKFSGLKIGLTSGVIHFLLGFGKYGPFSIFQFAIIGLFFDLFFSIFPNKNGLVHLFIMGIFAGVLRFSTEFLLAWALGLPKPFYFLYLPYIISQTAFGGGSAFVSKKLLEKTKINE